MSESKGNLGDPDGCFRFSIYCSIWKVAVVDGVLHRHRGSSTGRCGGGVAIVHRDSVKVTAVDVGNYSQFESIAVKIIGRQSSIVVVCIYRPPGEVTSAVRPVRPADCWIAGLQLSATSTSQDRSLDGWTAALLTCTSSMDFDSTSALQPTSAAIFWTWS